MNRKKRRRLKQKLIRIAVLALGIGGLGLTACMVGPDYVRPDVVSDNSIRAALSLHPERAGSVAPFTLLDFHDPVLNDLIALAERNSPTLRQAVARLKQARAEVRISAADEMPELNAGAKYNALRESRNMGLMADDDYYQVGLDASWELDIFGGNRRRTEAAEAGWIGARAALADARISLAAEVALAYVRLRTTEELLRRAFENLKIQEDIAQLTQDKYDTGLTDEISLKQARYAVENTRASIPQLRAQAAVQRNALALLTGQLPGAVDELLDASMENLVNKPFRYQLQTLYDLPVDVVRCRPDVRSAEESLVAQNALIGAAVADLYPKISITGFLGFESLHGSDWITGKSFMANAVPQVSLPIFHFGALKNNVELQKQKKEEQAVAYEQAVLQAAGDIRNALVNLENEQKRNRSARAAYQNMKEASELTRNRYQNGLIEYTDVLNAEERRLSAQEQMIQSNGQQYQNIVSFYKAIGGDTVFGGRAE